MSKRFGAGRTQEEIDAITKQMESLDFTFELFRGRQMFTHNVTKQRINMKGAAKHLQRLEEVNDEQET